MPNRADHHFCCGACRADYERTSGKWRERYHADNNETYYHTCENCGRGFSQSGYTERGGQRRRRFCSDYCRGQYHRGAKHSEKARQQQRKNPFEDFANWARQEQGRRQTPPPPPPSRAKFDPWSILGVKFGSSKAEIKKAYRDMARKFHPDINSTPGAEERMKDINRAYDEIGR